MIEFDRVRSFIERIGQLDPNLSPDWRALVADARSYTDDLDAVEAALGDDGPGNPVDGTVADLARLLTEATPGPWTWTGEERFGWHFGREDSQDATGRAYSEADTALIVAAVNMLPDLIALHQAAKEVNYVFECRCDDAYTTRKLHGPDCHVREGEDFLAALARLEGETP